VKILLAPSETKRPGGEGVLQVDTLLFNELTPVRTSLLERYSEIIQKGDIALLSKMFGLKKEADILAHRIDILRAPVMKAIRRYTGVAFDHLAYDELDEKAQAYIDTHVILNSNLFGFLRADDHIPPYRLKQGEPVGDMKVDTIFRQYGAPLMEAYLADEEILDLRAGYYDKFYKPAKAYTTLKFVKNGKVVSHWAKAYRGIVLREIAKAGVKTLRDALALPIEGLKLLEIQTKGNRQEVIYAIDT
jgi:cytoplasmic iron level regulating protein YaaA (DUF328/UPF0246 family)